MNGCLCLCNLKPSILICSCEGQLNTYHPITHTWNLHLKYTFEAISLKYHNARAQEKMEFEDIYLGTKILWNCGSFVICIFRQFVDDPSYWHQGTYQPLLFPLFQCFWRQFFASFIHNSASCADCLPVPTNLYLGIAVSGLRVFLTTWNCSDL